MDKYEIKKKFKIHLLYFIIITIKSKHHYFSLISD